MVVSRDTPVANATTWPSRVTLATRGMLEAPRLRTASMIQRARNRPAAPPATASTRLSVRSCRTSRQRPAPSAPRSDISDSRAAARAKRTWATFTQAMRSTSATAAKSSRIAGRTSPTTISLSGVTVTWRLVPGNDASSVPVSAVIASRAASIDVPGCSRANTRRLLPVRCVARAVRSSGPHNSLRVAQNGANRSPAASPPRSSSSRRRARSGVQSRLDPRRIAGATAHRRSRPARTRARRVALQVKGVRRASAALPATHAERRPSRARTSRRGWASSTSAAPMALKTVACRCQSR